MSEASGGGGGRRPEGFMGSGRNGTLTREDAQRLLEELAASGKSMKTFSKEKGLSTCRLGWWRTKFSQERRAAQASAAFVPVTLVRTTQAQTSWELLELVLQTGQVVRVPRNFDEVTLKRLVMVLEGRAQC